MEEAVQEGRRATQLEPFQHPFGLELALLHARHYDSAIEEMRLREEAQPSDTWVRYYLAKCYRLKGMGKESAMELADLYKARGNKCDANAVRRTRLLAELLAEEETLSYVGKRE